MNKNIIIILSCFIILSCSKKNTELILLGTVHQPIENFNSDSLYNILVKIKPDLILYECDSSFFTTDFKFKKTWDSNENIATIKYMNTFDVKVRPYDFTGRNEYRIKIGSRPTDSKAFKMLDSLYKNGVLNPQEEQVYKEFLVINDTLNSFAYLGPKAFNNLKTDSVSSIRQDFQYKKLGKIMANIPAFKTTYHKKADGDSISYLEGYKRASDFWQLRNKTMSKNILHFTEEYRNQRIVVLNGYFHRYYLNALLRSKQNINDFTIKEFHEY
ncbi:hypothetical protein IWQ47_000054 [Aquimarina sp. EL_43]|uniref:hypothetical protein n=1 Tax=unclassified Aquimarina TaxID=2627091 RepID=UPI0018CAE5BA|nr:MULTISPECIES: hypothetical protein [unclassified Aquimarina]MBG6129253.1 hypothetical protein [Aquimarina sp. EL_35]MBG6150318.1 hypothetical protein [Aquimarina sp. EL_32]MBG6166996.1 hypothetical protein [Aquimarina sp. EL_43]